MLQLSSEDSQLQPTGSLSVLSAFKSSPVPKYIYSNDLPTRKIVTRKQRLQRLLETERKTPKNNDEIYCRNCGGTEKVASPADGDYICVECGAVYAIPIFAELVPFFWGSRAADTVDNTVIPANGLSMGTGSTYVRYFHFNEILATILLTGPWIPNSDMRLIREELKGESLTRPSKSDIQSVCKTINKKYGVRRFSQKYSEKWIQIIFRYSGSRPEDIDPETVESLRSGFRLLSYCWDDASTMLVGSKDPNRRIQWPNYLETLYRILRYKHPDVLQKIKDWIPRLSKKKRRDLKPFFKRLFYLVGWAKK